MDHGGSRHILAPDLLESQLAMIDLIRAMYPPLDEDRDSSTQKHIEQIREWCEKPESAVDLAARFPPPSLSLVVTIPVEAEDGSGASPPCIIQMNVNVLLSSSEKDLAEPPSLTYLLRQPAWMSRAEVADLGADMPQGDILAAFDHIQENAPRYLKRGDAAASQAQDSAGGESGGQGPLLRVWFYFPSLSTREKRKDLVSYAPRYRLTGFVLAGKPGVLCLEGSSRNVDDYMNAIKNESWGDIPSHQKKVSERFREECGEEGRKFEDMREITDDLGEKRGARKNRGDMAALEAFLKEKGVGESFSKVVMGT